MGEGGRDCVGDREITEMGWGNREQNAGERGEPGEKSIISGRPEEGEVKKERESLTNGARIERLVFQLHTTVTHNAACQSHCIIHCFC